MLKIRVTYPDGKGGKAEKDLFIEYLKSNYSVLGLSREYSSRNKGLYKSIYADVVEYVPDDAMPF